MTKILQISSRKAHIKRKIRRHFSNLGFVKGDDGMLRPPNDEKQTIRAMHAAQRRDKILANQNFLLTKYPVYKKYFASGTDVVPKMIKPRLELVDSSSKLGDLFRLASLTWSVPVSSGFGRRMRYLVWDDHNGKLIGLIGLTDPVFNLKARDDVIGWNSSDRAKRLVNVMDAFVMGAVPPYNKLLCGKMIPCLIKSKEVYNDFLNKYGNAKGIISGKKKSARLLLVTTSSSMGRSSVYNRLRISGSRYFDSVGYTEGWGHFHIPEDLFLEMRSYLRDIKHPYADLCEYGNGPNWKIRAIKACLSDIGMRQDFLRHGIMREVFVSNMFQNSKELLLTGEGVPCVDDLLSVDEISELALNRWVIPRAEKNQDFLDWDSEQIFSLINGNEVVPQLTTKDILLHG